MTCPVCGGDTKVYDTKLNTETVCRRRRCLECGYKFKTVEMDEDMFSMLKDYQHRIAVGFDELTKFMDGEKEMIRKKLDGISVMFEWRR